MIESAVIKQIYLGDGETTQFPFAFPFGEAEHIKVAIYDIETETETPLTSDYYVDAAASKVLYPGYPPGEEPPGSERPGPLPVGQKLVIYRDTPINQLEDLGEKYPLQIIEDMVDKATMILQEFGDKLARALIVEMAADITPQEFYSNFRAGVTTAIEKASEALASATSASNSATSASNSATAASNSATAAGNSATAANNSKIAAAASETNAGNSASAAAGSATVAYNSQVAAAASETAAGNYATAAGTSATNAGNSATAAGNSATSAHNSQVAAKASEDAAAQSAAEAAGINYLVRKNNTTYTVGVVAFYQTIPSPLVLECTTAGTTAATAPDFSGAVEGDTIADGEVVWTYRSLLNDSGGSDEAADINMTNYEKPGSYTPVSASDNVLTAIGKIEARPAGVLPQIMVTAPTGCTVTATNDGTTLTAIESSGTYELDVPNFGDWTVTCAKTIDDTPYSTTKVISALEVRRYEVDMHYGHRYGFRISKTESSPADAVEYILDAEGMTPAHMDFTNGVFDYGDWGNVWFVTDNKPLMLKSDGTVDYYLDPNDYDKKVDGTSSDVANTSYDGNAMAQFPLVWVKRYEDSEYWYEIISDVQIDSSYKAYAHTRMDGTIAPYFYYAMFRGSGNASRIRSLAGQTLAGSLTAANEVAGATANGSLWYTQTWSQYQLIRTLLMLMGKSRDARSVFGTGNAHSASSASGLLQTGTLKTMGQFYGYNTNNQQVKVFHCEAPWGEQRLRIAGLITNSRKVYAKMTREGEGYKVTDVTGYDDTGITIPSFDASYIKSVVCSDYGMIPIASGGSSSTYFCCPAWSASSMIYPSVGGGASDTAAYVGFSTIYAHAAASTTGFHIGCGLSCEMPVQA